MRKLPRHVTVRVDPRTAADLHLYAVNHGTTASALLRGAIRATLAKPANDVRDVEPARHAG